MMDPARQRRAETDLRELTATDPEPPLPWCVESNAGHLYRRGSCVWCNAPAGSDSKRSL